MSSLEPARIYDFLCTSISPKRTIIDQLDAPRQCHNESLVWLVARPLQSFPVSFVASKFQILHWAVLVGPVHWGSEQMKAHFSAFLQPWPSHLQHYQIGTILEIRRDANRTSPRFGPFQTDDFLREFPRSSISYVGRTVYTTKQVESLGRMLQSDFDNMQPGESGSPKVGIIEFCTIIVRPLRRS
jgi:hypothetical protein